MGRDTHRVGEQVVKTPEGQVEDEIQSVKIVVGGASHVVDLETVGLLRMRDNAYRVMIHGKTAGAGGFEVDEPTITETGFTILGGAATEVAHVFIHGKIRDRVR
jgi:hypothetical protein